MSAIQSFSDSDDLVGGTAVQEPQRQPYRSSKPSPSPSLAGSNVSPSQPLQNSLPMQKRRRITRACDECRRKKIKCDGKQPCTHCTVYSYDCTYDQPSNRRRNPAPHYVDALEAKLQLAEKILRVVVPDLSLDDPDKAEKQLTGLGIARPLEENTRIQAGNEEEKEPMLESMVENTVALEIDDDGFWDFHGHSSGRAFLLKMRQQFGDLMGRPEGHAMPLMKHPKHTETLAKSPETALNSPLSVKPPNLDALPAKHCAILLCQNALDDTCAVLRFIHQPSFYEMLDQMYSAPTQSMGGYESKFLSLLYSVLALGTLFATDEQSQLMTNGFENAIDQGNRWFRASRSIIDVTDCRDLISLQTVLIMILFLQCTARLSTCYSHIGIVLRSAIRLGLHRSVPNAFNPIEQETRKRVFWCVRKLDAYVGALLGLPKLLNDEDIDQEMPLEIDDDYITLDKFLPMPSDQPSLTAAFNAHTRIVEILSKTVKFVYPVKGTKGRKNQNYIVSHSKIREIEQDLQKWTRSLPEAFRPDGQAPPKFARSNISAETMGEGADWLCRIQQILRMAYAHIEMMLYRPFLHYASREMHGKSLDKRSYACAAACVSVSRNIVHLTGEMKRRGMLVGSYWFYMYTTFFAIISCVFYVLENPQSALSMDILKDAYEGKDTLAGLAKRSLAADRCSKQLAELFEQLPEKLDAVRSASIPQQTLRQAPPSRSQMHSQYSSSSTTPLVDHTLAQSSGTQPMQQDYRKGPSTSCGTEHVPLQSSDNINSRFDMGLQNPYGSQPDIIGSHLPDMFMNQTNFRTQNPPDGQSIPDLSAMMFPSEDPFAYPNQPMITLENSQFVKQESPVGHNRFNDTASMIRSPYEGLDPPAHGDIRQYTADDGQNNFGRQDSMNLNASSLHPTLMGGLGHERSRWKGQQQGGEPVESTPGRNLDGLFAEDWGGWLYHG